MFWALGSDCLVSVSGFSNYDLLAPQFPHLQNRDNDSSYIMRIKNKGKELRLVCGTKCLNVK